MFETQNTTSRVVTFKHPLLREVCTDVDPFTFNTEIIFEMINTLKEYKGLGLAANQIGYSVRAIVMKNAEDKYVFFLNPVITERAGKLISEEGCISIPGCYGDVERSGKITITSDRINGTQLVKTFIGREAIIIQHEIDHLDGILFTDKALYLRYEKPT